ncbi:hypothetical protein DET61_12047 [Marinobacter nauticus]|jgi:hypothetical protein|uniref:Uncharacterized protein n=1 Tax=Marinobacter nauticus TaxID=2743 RepID=A0A368X534_MARNT|nr:hypothetical protein [Marinobacter nauticus]RCW62925.1 hypothetical protein DET61_12047 [Marinobacter nauticus]
MRANNSGKKVDLTSVLQDVDDEVREVHASVSESAIRDQQINMMMLSRMHQVCAEEPAKAAFKYNLPTDVVELIAESGPDFYMKIQPLADKFMFDLSRNADILRRALKSETTLQSRFYQVGRMYSADISEQKTGKVA